MDSITPAKQKRIIKTAQHYLQAHNWTNKVFCRFDALGIIEDERQQKHSKPNYKAEWIKNAFSL
jgi:putative endonuclease